MSKTKWIILGVFLGLVTFFAGGLSCYIAGRSDERAANQQQLADAQATLDTERTEHKRIVEAYEAGNQRVTDRLTGAIRNAASSTDRSIRLAQLMDAIESALLEYGITLNE